jgi:hypothetical protein
MNTIALMPIKDAIITVRVPAPLKDALQRAAEADMRTLASLTAKVLSEYAHQHGLLKAEGQTASGGAPKARKGARRG